MQAPPPRVAGSATYGCRPHHLGLQVPPRTVAGPTTYGCRCHHVGLQALPPTVAGPATYGCRCGRASCWIASFPTSSSFASSSVTTPCRTCNRRWRGLQPYVAGPAPANPRPHPDPKPNQVSTPCRANPNPSSNPSPTLTQVLSIPTQVTTSCRTCPPWRSVTGRWTRSSSCAPCYS